MENEISVLPATVLEYPVPIDKGILRSKALLYSKIGSANKCGMPRSTTNLS